MFYLDKNIENIDQTSLARVSKGEYQTLQQPVLFSLLSLLLELLKDNSKTGLILKLYLKIFSSGKFQS